MRVGLGRRDPRLEARGHREIVSHVLRVQIELKGDPEIRRSIGDKTATNDPDDKIGLSIQLNRRSHDMRIGAVPILPKPVAQHCHVAAMRTVFRGGKGAPRNHRSAEHREIVRRDMNSLHLLWMVTARNVESRSPEVVCGDLLKD